MRAHTDAFPLLPGLVLGGGYGGRDVFHVEHLRARRVGIRAAIAATGVLWNAIDVLVGGVKGER